MRVLLYTYVCIYYFIKRFITKKIKLALTSWFYRRGKCGLGRFDMCPNVQGVEPEFELNLSDSNHKFWGKWKKGNKLKDDRMSSWVLVRSEIIYS